MLRLSIALVALVGTATAQIVPSPQISASFTGIVEKVPILTPAPSASGPIIAPPCILPRFQLRCARGTFFIQSSTVDLETLLGRNVKLWGRSVLQCPNIFEIARVAPPPVELVLCGTPGLGCPIRLRSTPGALSRHYLLFSFRAGLQPLSPDAGSILLGQPLFLIAAQSVGGVQGAAFDLVIPANAALTGAELFFQTARHDIGPVGPVRMSNAVCMKILGFTFWCEPPGC